MEHIGIVNKEGYIVGSADFHDVCKAAAEIYAEERSKHECLTVINILGEDREGVINFTDEMNQKFLVFEKGKGCIGVYARRRESRESEWGEWFGGLF